MEEKETQEQKEPQTIEAKHIFLDIVSYTYNRSVEAQSDLIYILNSIVKETIEEKELKNDQYIFIPTGDGMCISIINVNSPYDIHIQIALSILEKLYKHNKGEQDEMRQFELRIGINENTDNLVIDINNNKNVSGSGINIASRIEGLSDNSQIIVGNSVFEKLVQREKYMNSFKSYKAEVKHGLPLNVHQFINDDLEYLNNEVPSRFVPKTKVEFTLSTFQGYYIANCIKYESFLGQKISDLVTGHELRILLYQLTEDCISRTKVSKSNPIPSTKVDQPIEDYFKYLRSISFWITADFSNLINEKHLNKISAYFEGYHNIFVNQEGKDKLCKDHPEICTEFGIS